MNVNTPTIVKLGPIDEDELPRAAIKGLGYQGRYADDVGLVEHEPIPVADAQESDWTDLPELERQALLAGFVAVPEQDADAQMDAARGSITGIALGIVAWVLIVLVAIGAWHVVSQLP